MAEEPFVGAAVPVDLPLRVRHVATLAPAAIGVYHGHVALFGACLANCLGITGFPFALCKRGEFRDRIRPWLHLCLRLRRIVCGTASYEQRKAFEYPPRNPQDDLVRRESSRCLPSPNISTEPLQKT